MPIKKSEVTKEFLMKAMQCENAEELMEVAKAAGYGLTKEEAEAYMAELEDYELDSEELSHVAGGECWGDLNQLKNCPSDCTSDTNK